MFTKTLKCYQPSKEHRHVPPQRPPEHGAGVVLPKITHDRSIDLGEVISEIAFRGATV